MDCRISYDKQGVATVVDEGGSPSRLYGRILAVTEDQKTAINIWSAAVDPNQGLAGESTTLEDVLRFMDSKAAENMTLSPVEELLMKDVMVRNGFNTLSELSSTLVQLFKPNGVIELPGRDTTGRNLYTQDDLRALDLVALNNLLQKMEGYLMREQEIYVVPQEQRDLYLNTNDKNALGMSEKLTAEEVSTTLLSKIKDFTNEVEIENVVKEAPFAEFAEKFQTNKTFRQQILNDLKDLRRIPTLSVVAGQLTDRNEAQYITLKNMILSKAPTTVLEAEMEYVASITDFVWRNNPDVVKGLLKEIESELIKLNIDVIGLSEHTNSKEVVLDILSEAFQMVKNPTHGNIKSFTDKLQVLIPQPDNSIVELIDERYKDYNIVHVEALGSEVDLFNAYGLIKVGEDLYHKVDQTADINTLIDFLAKRYVEGEFVLPKEFVTAKDLTNKVAVLKDVTNFISAQKEPLGLANKMLYTAYKKIFDHETSQPTPVEQVSNITTIKTDESYLKSDFISDFYRYILEEKAKNSQLYRSVLKHFYISDKDISLKGRPASIKGIKFEQELTDYIKIKRGEKMRHLIEETASPYILEDLVAVNFPETVVEIDEEYMMHGPKHAVLPSTPRTFVKLNDKLFRKAGSNLDADIFYQITTPVNPVYLTAGTNFTLDQSQAIGHLNNHENLVTPVELSEEANSLVPIEGVSKITVYHGGDLSEGFRANEPIFVSEQEAQVGEYAKGNKGKINTFELDNSKIAKEQDAVAIIKELDLKSKNTEWDVNDLNLYELLDTRFETSLSDSDIQKVYLKLKKGGFEAVRFTDMNLSTLKNNVSNIIVLDANSLVEKTLGKESLFGQNRNIADYATVLDSRLKLVNLYTPSEVNEIVSKINDCQG